MVTATTTNTPTVGEKADRILDEMETLMERLWDIHVWDEPADMTEEVVTRAQRWLSGFTEMCYCNREIRYCAC